MRTGTSHFFCRARRFPAGIPGVFQGEATSHGGKWPSIRACSQILNRLLLTRSSSHRAFMGLPPFRVTVAIGMRLGKAHLHVAPSCLADVAPSAALGSPLDSDRYCIKANWASFEQEMLSSFGIMWYTIYVLSELTARRHIHKPLFVISRLNNCV